MDELGSKISALKNVRKQADGGQGLHCSREFLQITLDMHQDVLEQDRVLDESVKQHRFFRSLSRGTGDWADHR